MTILDNLVDIGHLIVSDQPEAALAEFESLRFWQPDHDFGSLPASVNFHAGRWRRAVELFNDHAQYPQEKLIHALSLIACREFTAANRVLTDDDVMTVFYRENRLFKRKDHNCVDALDARVPRWNGSMCDRLVVTFEHGFGDSFNAMRHLAAARARCAHLTAMVPAPLVDLIGDHPTVDRVVKFAPGAADNIEADASTNWFFMPAVLDAGLESASGYLTARPGPDLRGPDLNIGLAWRGAQTNFYKARRDVPLSVLQRLASVPGCTFHNLLPDDDPDAWPLAAPPFARHAPERLEGFARTSSLLAQLDIVIAVDSSVAQLAGALGRPVWILLPFRADYRWGDDRDTTPLYDTARIFRQDSPGDWGDVMERVAHELDVITVP